MGAKHFGLRRQRRDLRQRAPHLRGRALKQAAAPHGKQRVACGKMPAVALSVTAAPEIRFVSNLRMSCFHQLEDRNSTLLGLQATPGKTDSACGKYRVMWPRVCPGVSNTADNQAQSSQRRSNASHMIVQA